MPRLTRVSVTEVPLQAALDLVNRGPTAFCRQPFNRSTFFDQIVRISYNQSYMQVPSIVEWLATVVDEKREVAADAKLMAASVWLELKKELG